METCLLAGKINFFHCFVIFYADRSVRITPERPYSPPSGHPHTVTPRKSVPIPTRFEPPQFDISPIPTDGFDEERIPGNHGRVEQNEVHVFSPKKSSQKEIPEVTDEHVSSFFSSFHLFATIMFSLPFYVDLDGKKTIVDADLHVTPQKEGWISSIKFLVLYI